METIGFGKDAISWKMPASSITKWARYLFAGIIGYSLCYGLHDVGYLMSYSSSLSAAYADLSHACLVTNRPWTANKPQRSYQQTNASPGSF